MEQVGEKVSDGRVLGLVEAFLNQRVLDGMKSWTPEGGTPQGAVLSPLLSNLYLSPLDHEMEQAGVEMVRYADDFVLLCRSREEAERALERVREWTATAGLTLHLEKTRVVDATRRKVLTFWVTTSSEAGDGRGRRAGRNFGTRFGAKTRRANGHELEGRHRRAQPDTEGLV